MQSIGTARPTQDPPTATIASANTASAHPQQMPPSIALTMLSAHAREKQSPVNNREEADARIDEMYGW